MPASYSLYELTEYIRRVIALNFTEPIWVNCEISQIKEVRGNVYLDLVYHDETTNEVTAQMSANIWYKSYLFLKNKLGALLPSLLVQGTHVQLKVIVEYSEKYGMKLVVEDIEPSYTIGQMEMKRQKILQQLQDEGYIHVNKLRETPAVIQRLAVISSDTAAGYIDFSNHLANNSYGYAFSTTLYKAALQGQNTERDVCEALRQINENHREYDLILIIRGGGSKTDLAWFDNYNIGVSIAKSELPVITGIGHDIDSTVADSVAFRSLKTPTAVADFIIEHNMEFEAKVIEVLRWITQLSGRTLKYNQLELTQMTQMLRMLPAEIIRNNRLKLGQVMQQISLASAHRLKYNREALNNAESRVSLLHPKNVLKRGFAILRQDQLIIRSTGQYRKNVAADIELYDGKITINPYE